MPRQRPHLLLTVALCFALRALVPVGYMLNAPAPHSASFGFKLSLCPIQNPALDLDLLAGAAAAHAHHHHGGNNALDDPLTLDVANGCTAWLNSGSLAWTGALPELQRPAATPVYVSLYRAAPSAGARRTPLEARAPPV